MSVCRKSGSVVMEGLLRHFPLTETAHLCHVPGYPRDSARSPGELLPAVLGETE
jgi:hypothetical protein